MPSVFSPVKFCQIFARSEFLVAQALLPARLGFSFAVGKIFLRFIRVNLYIPSWPAD